jgi:predicted RNase H-like HicB family nuclease
MMREGVEKVRISPCLQRGIFNTGCAMIVGSSYLEGAFMRYQFKIIVEKNPDGYVAYPLGLKGIVVGQGDTYEEALSDVSSAIRFHIETFGEEVLESEPPVLEAFVAEMGINV